MHSLWLKRLLSCNRARGASPRRELDGARIRALRQQTESTSTTNRVNSPSDGTDQHPTNNAPDSQPAHLGNKYASGCSHRTPPSWRGRSPRTALVRPPEHPDLRHVTHRFPVLTGGALKPRTKLRSFAAIRPRLPRQSPITPRRSPLLWQHVVNADHPRLTDVDTANSLLSREHRPPRRLTAMAAIASSCGVVSGDREQNSVKLADDRDVTSLIADSRRRRIGVPMAFSTVRRAHARAPDL
jgi:hypothetical protein